MLVVVLVVRLPKFLRVPSEVLGDVHTALIAEGLATV